MSGCRWCLGVDSECEHCGGHGVLTDPPLDARPETTVPDKTIHGLALEWMRRPRPMQPAGEPQWGTPWLIIQQRYIRSWEETFLTFFGATQPTQVLTDIDVHALAMFWADPFRDVPLDDYIKCVANVVETRYNGGPTTVKD